VDGGVAALLVALADAADAITVSLVEPWDVVPLQAVVEAAGGRVSMLDCGAPRPAALFTNGHLHESALDVLRA
jgi:fructose-1,6-bisphosphatase/inositol monophosphatase family enzyme